MSIIELAKLGREEWGERLARARRRKGIAYRDARDAIAPVLPMSHAAIANLEARAAPPTLKRQRFAAFLLAHVYGIDPAEFGVGPGDVPSGFDPADVVSLLGISERSRCTGASDNLPILRIAA